MKWHVVTSEDLPCAGAGVAEDTGEIIAVYPPELVAFVGRPFTSLLGWMETQPGFKHTVLDV